MKKIAFTGGGTIGHVAVNLALIPEAEKRNIETIYIGSKNGIEREMIESSATNTQYIPISSGKLRRYLSFDNLKDIFKVIKGIFDARKALKKEKPDFVFSKGGFVSVPVIIAAKSLKIPSIIHESDVTPGLANKIAMKFSNKLYTTFEETLKYVPKEKSDFIGAIIREDLRDGSKEEGYKLTGFNSELPVLLIMGGSLGSKVINKTIHDNLDYLTKKYQIIHLTGKGNVDPNINKEGYVQYEFVSKELMHFYAITDTVISRAGANAIYEFATLQIPMLLIPLGLDQSRGDQIDNAKIFEGKGFAKVLQEKEVNQSNLVRNLDQLENERETIIKKMSQFKESYTKETLFNKIESDIK
ncbi:undecaprenyldiphospho-muramoylpentapeptide beta-N-acetylglucosaminyltransferase [Mammaliicoccus stepanovicii]|uniref:UDP-N-acetylglucosamine--N-acetylmuramyl-(pentapeptide) pyrophosphoryl-undecaprenol N-acetylglucosamine transferase n=1 Tax=Mammaliicoccus stepanovicii TaxID=643214 RepID=A0A239ZAL1_9STAP|nr:undecaprenyldiphospho-muramoylpentapeptide beta-N-acetylglucosaminyltransferase [Mammaliicoccus stepanovicii]PNZ73872.1 undecaprenyldiphospho-muramoylpentapeptide beta-N-acetylglucosaminyltransferase [Mammaliicoccus stepanovicii]GGI42174.1 UDP-N-acetylglucosamine--N-acetylmuramyl-(pentapeptide) pyrophosphoryl-undecaprenol N-acetylglucosamine transferase [Mammaliicoccus stepanovicii]SNV68155.1 undecaprenyldiphospho-muramoylpentapeptide beta-N- acetylglucosaminyltransferase [Mammaliicoccus step